MSTQSLGIHRCLLSVLFVLALQFCGFEARRLVIAGDDSEDDDDDVECSKKEDCVEGFEGECDAGVCFYTVPEGIEGDGHFEQCSAACSSYFGDFFEGPTLDGRCRRGSLCDFWRKLLTFSSSEASWVKLVHEMSSDSADSADAMPAVPGLLQGSREDVAGCYCGRLCQMGSAADLGSDADFWSTQKRSAPTPDVPEGFKERLAFMELVHADWPYGTACPGVYTGSIVGAIAAATAEEAPSLLDVSSHSNSSSSHQVGFNPFPCLGKLNIFSPHAQKAARGAAEAAAQTAAVETTRDLGHAAVHHGMRQAPKTHFVRDFLAFAGKYERRAADAVSKVMPRVSKNLRSLARSRGTNGIDSFGDAATAAGVVTSLATGDIGGATASSITYGLNKLAGGSLATALGLSGGAAIAFGLLTSIGISIAVSSTAAAVGGAGTAGAAGAGGLSGLIGLIKHGCK
eukprot:TRINITY_DN49707_c0_g1_i1.p1 TRINITY_DN49707_c0_g1~~TRINITY_DN49707_c0_g1_i1.p1  ORF type:complete len:471 (+),score=98.11 TRINITY_DN49707_c0_g1_i1:43-1413(+)